MRRNDKEGESDNTDAKRSLHTTQSKSICKSDKGTHLDFLCRRAKMIDALGLSDECTQELARGARIKATMEKYDSFKVLDGVLRRKGTGACTGITIKEVREHMRKIVETGRATAILVSFTEIGFKWDDDRILVEIFRCAPIESVVEVVKYCIASAPLKDGCVNFVYRQDFLRSNRLIQREYIYYCLLKNKHDTARSVISEYEGTLFDHQGIRQYFDNTFMKEDHVLENELRARENISPRTRNYDAVVLSPASKRSF